MQFFKHFFKKEEVKIEEKIEEKKDLTNQEVVEIVKNGMTVGALIEKLNEFDKNLVVINDNSKKQLPYINVTKFKTYYPIDEEGREVYETEVVCIW